MGVDISLHIEIRQSDKWHLMTFQSPYWKQDHKYDIFNTEVYNCRYYHFREFIGEASSHISGNRDILSEELQAKLNGDEYDTGFGVFMFNDLEKHCEKLEKHLLSGLFHTGIYSIKEQLDRIEQKIEYGKATDTTFKKREETYEETTSMEQMYDDFMWDYGCLFGLRDVVKALTSIGNTYIQDSDIRLFYLIC